MPPSAGWGWGRRKCARLNELRGLGMVCIRREKMKLPFILQLPLMAVKAASRQLHRRYWVQRLVLTFANQVDHLQCRSESYASLSKTDARNSIAHVMQDTLSDQLLQPTTCTTSQNLEPVCISLRICTTVLKSSVNFADQEKHEKVVYVPDPLGASLPKTNAAAVLRCSKP